MNYLGLGLAIAWGMAMAAGATIAVVSIFTPEPRRALKRDGQCRDCDEDALPDEPWCGRCRQLAYAI